MLNTLVFAKLETSPDWNANYLRFLRVLVFLDLLILIIFVFGLFCILIS